jgi:hypothetical protein
MGSTNVENLNSIIKRAQSVKVVQRHIFQDKCNCPQVIPFTVYSHRFPKIKEFEGKNMKKKQEKCVLVGQ